MSAKSLSTPRAPLSPIPQGSPQAADSVVCWQVLSSRLESAPIFPGELFQKDWLTPGTPATSVAERVPAAPASPTKLIPMLWAASSPSQNVCRPVNSNRTRSLDR